MAVDALHRLGALPGMLAVKAQVEQMIQFKRVSKFRAQQGLKTQTQSNHMVFTGNPGTGKTTAARLIGEAFAAMGFLKSPGDCPFVEVHHSDITHPHVGQAERTLKQKINNAKGGVLFIDEAYAFIAGESSHMTGDKVVAALVQLMEDMRDEMIVIAAGYPDEMNDFLSSNPGLYSRFTNKVHFPDYTVPDMVLIAQTMLDDQEYQADNAYLDKLAERLWVEKTRKGFGNARTVRNIVEESIRLQSVRVSQLNKPSRQDLMVLRAEDLRGKTDQRSEKEILLMAQRDIQQRLRKLEFLEFLGGEPI